MNLLCRFATFSLVALIFATATTPSADAVTIDWVTVGDPGNANDTTGYGGVAEAFRIMRFEWTNADYVLFLNAIDPDGTNPNSVYNNNMGFSVRGGIAFNSGASSEAKYSTKANMANKPVNTLTWWNAARVSNWLHNGSQTYASTDATSSAPQNTGAYSVGTATSGNAVARNLGALYWVPNENEWYKAAYYDPTLNGGLGGYRAYGNGFDSEPFWVAANSVGDGSAGSSGNFANFLVTANWNFVPGNVTTVGTNGGSSYYGAFDMSGNVAEWNDLDGTAGPRRGIRGGSWGSIPWVGLSSVSRSTNDPLGDGDNFGFRLASPVPEPATLGMASTGALCACGWWLLKRQQRRAR